MVAKQNIEPIASLPAWARQTARVLRGTRPASDNSRVRPPNLPTLGKESQKSDGVSCTREPKEYSVGASLASTEHFTPAHAAAQDSQPDLHSLGGRPPRDPQSDGVPVSSERVTPVTAPDHLRETLVRALTRWLTLELERAPRKGVQPDGSESFPSHF